MPIATRTYHPPVSASHGRGLTTITQTIGAWSGVAAALFRAGIQALQGVPRDEHALHAFADFVGKACDPSEVDAALVCLAHRVSGAARVELHRREAPGRSLRQVARWPAVDVARAAPQEVASGGHAITLRLGVVAGGADWGELRFAADRRRWPTRLVRRLATLGTLAAASERALRASQGVGLPSPFDPLTGLYNQAFLEGLLAHALRQAQRRAEPLTLMLVSPDLPAVAPGQARPGFPDACLQAVARVVRETLRQSDIVARLDAGALAAVLCAAPAHDAPTIADTLRRAIAEAGLTTGSPLPVTASIGFASFPNHAAECQVLLARARDALCRARREAGNGVASWPDSQTTPNPGAPSCAR